MEKTLAFNELGLSANALAAIEKKGFEEPTPIQVITIPVMLQDDKNIIAQAQTGTGKTAAFSLPLIDMVDPLSRNVQALILVPTRELAIQVSEEINSLKGDKQIIVVPIYGGQSIDQQLRMLKKGVHIVVGSPGRIIDHLNRKTLKLQEIEHLILDEADEMLNMGFIEDIEEIMKHTNPQKRTLLFSATIPSRIKSLAKKYMDDYELIKVKNETLTTDLTEQIYFEVKASDKFEALCRIIDIEPEFYGLIFCRTKIDVDEVVNHLTDRGYDAEAIHGDISQAQRERTLEKFKKRRANILVATDVAARGIDVSNLTHVINYALPQDPESYVHRIGRTGRAGHEGTAITFITPSEYKRLMFIQRIAKTDIKKSRVPQIQDIINAKKNKINEDIVNLLQKKSETRYFNWAKNLLEDNNPTEILAAVLHYSFEDDLNPEAYGEIKDLGTRGKQVDQQGKTRLFVALGRKDGINPQKLVELVQSKITIKSRAISEIQILDNFSFLTVPFEQAEEIIVRFKEKGEKSLITHARKRTDSDSRKSTPRKKRKT
ncbi:MAG: DEAD/DEAH box helicase [Candidatus Cloacimonetes bacterium]|nr:DEAD/DEAH box helicase [Candidatus Cloacimonadota bacterium]